MASHAPMTEPLHDVVVVGAGLAGWRPHAISRLRAVRSSCSRRVNASEGASSTTRSRTARSSSRRPVGRADPARRVLALADELGLGLFALLRRRRGHPRARRQAGALHGCDVRAHRRRPRGRRRRPGRDGRARRDGGPRLALDDAGRGGHRPADGRCLAHRALRDLRRPAVLACADRRGHQRRSAARPRCCTGSSTSSRAASSTCSSPRPAERRRAASGAVPRQLRPASPRSSPTCASRAR